MYGTTIHSAITKFHDPDHWVGLVLYRNDINAESICLWLANCIDNEWRSRKPHGIAMADQALSIASHGKLQTEYHDVVGWACDVDHWPDTGNGACKSMLHGWWSVGLLDRFWWVK